MFLSIPGQQRQTQESSSFVTDLLQDLLRFFSFPVIYCFHKSLRISIRAPKPQGGTHMTRRSLSRRLTAILLVLALAVALVPAALAAASCPQCGGEVQCTDNGDGRTHTLYCPADGYTNRTAAHTFASGRCTACGAMDYSQVRITLPTDVSLTAALRDGDAAVSLEGVSLTLGTEDVTGEYTLSYSWYYNGNPVGTGQRCALPASVIGKEGDYDFVCFVTAVPGNALAGKTISASCTVKVHVQDLLSVTAVVGSRDLYLGLGDSTGRTPVSVADQITRAVAAKGGTASYVVFDKKPASTAGDLKFAAGERYQLSGSDGAALSAVRFEPSAAGTYAIGFTAYDQEGKAYPGLLTIAVEQALGSVDVLYVTEKGAAVTLNVSDFQAFWQKTYPQGQLTLIRFTALPTSSSGTLYRGYASAARPGTAVKAGESYYAAAGDHFLLQDVAFVPASRYTGPVSIPFEAYGSDGSGNQTYRSGRIFLFVNPTKVAAVTCSAPESGSAVLSASGFRSVYSAVTGSQDSGFYIRFLEVPASGSLYADSGATRLTDASINDKVFSYSAIGTLRYTAGTAQEESVRYAVYSSAGEPLYVGTLTFSVRAGEKNPYTDVKSTDWFYPYVIALTESGVIGGNTATTYGPRNAVTWGEALKMVLLAAGYDAQPSDGSHWASGYLSLALSEGILKESVPLRENITRGELAELAAAALTLTLSTDLKEAPFQDVPLTDEAAPAIAALKEAGIVGGTTLSDGQVVYRPAESLLRSEIAAIIWRIQQAG